MAVRVAIKGSVYYRQVVVVWTVHRWFSQNQTSSGNSDFRNQNTTSQSFIIFLLHMSKPMYNGYLHLEILSVVSFDCSSPNIPQLLFSLATTGPPPSPPPVSHFASFRELSFATVAQLIAISDVPV